LTLYLYVLYNNLMGIDQQPGLDQTAKRIDDVVRNSPPFKRDAEQQTSKAKETMRATMAGMEEARGRIGNFCVSVGSPEDPVSHGIILAAPIIEPYSPDYIKDAGGKTVWNGGTDQRSSLTYVLVTDGGFYLYDFHLGRTRFSTDDNRSPREEGYAFHNVIGDALKSTTSDSKTGSVITDRGKVDLIGHGLTVNSGKKDQMRFVFQPADQVTVDKALQASIKRVEAIYQPKTEAAQATGRTALSVKKQIGMEVKDVGSQDTAVGITKARTGLGRFFGRGR